jgi:hypothetical protein
MLASVVVIHIASFGRLGNTKCITGWEKIFGDTMGIDVGLERGANCIAMKEIIDQFESAAVLAREIGKTASTVRAWGNRDSLPAEFDLAIVRAGRKFGHPITLEMIAGLRASKAAAKSRRKSVSA